MTNPVRTYKIEKRYVLDDGRQSEETEWTVLETSTHELGRFADYGQADRVMKVFSACGGQA